MGKHGSPKIVHRVVLFVEDELIREYHELEPQDPPTDETAVSDFLSDLVEPVGGEPNITYARAHWDDAGNANFVVESIDVGYNDDGTNAASDDPDIVHDLGIKHPAIND